MVTPNVTNNNICTINHSIHQTVSPPIYIFVFIIGLPANCLSLYYGYLQIKAKNELGIYLCNLTIADLFYLFSLPLWLQYFFQHDDWTYNEQLCKICGILLYENIYISVGFLCCISMDRYLAVVHPFRFYQFRTIKAAVMVSVVIWIKEILMGWLIFQNIDISKDSESHTICFEHYPIKDWEHRFNYYRFFAGFLFPFSLLLFSYCGILRVVRKSHGTQKKTKVQIKCLVSNTVIIFLVCFGPYHILLVIRSLFETTCMFAAKIFNVYHFSLLLTSFNCVADPILYCFSSESTYQNLVKMRDSCLTCLRCFRTKKKECNQLKTPETLTKSSSVPVDEATRLNKLQSANEMKDSSTISIDKL
uniref:G protein-coupled receptor 68 n=1 Tax=Pelodiscus sinensis TaxID=13735 RepID=K7EZM3_PELSI|nr:ovarian cancer G-protein coupled receptor 1 [Pelodiscus sinensis]|eukprot:XP_006135568.1 ovarian cancer G-protein coupled receptor 1 [Pelodiscus sinensis]